MAEFNLEIIGLPTEFGDITILDSYRFENGLPFPLSYRKFVKQYGFGLTLEEFLIYIPIGDYGDSWNIRTKEIKSTYYDDVISGDIWFDIDPDGSVELLKRMVPFAASENGLYLFWDIKSYSKEEFDIYITDFRGLGFRKIGNSLYDAIDKLTSREHFKEIIIFSDKPLNKTFKCLSKVMR